jgi:hypothetical protein
MQVNSAATRNTHPSRLYKQLYSRGKLKPSSAKIIPYSGKPIHPLGETTMLFEGTTRFEPLGFEVIDPGIINSKPGMLSGRDSQCLGLVAFHKDKVLNDLQRM